MMFFNKFDSPRLKSSLVLRYVENLAKFFLERGVFALRLICRMDGGAIKALV